MQHNKTRLTMCGVLTACITASVLTTPLAIALGQSERITRPAVSEDVSPLESVAPVAHDGHRGQAVLRKPPGDGPFPAIVLIHGGLTTQPPSVCATTF